MQTEIIHKDRKLNHKKMQNDDKDTKKQKLTIERMQNYYKDTQRKK